MQLVILNEVFDVVNLWILILEPLGLEVLDEITQDIPKDAKKEADIANDEHKPRYLHAIINHK